MLPRWHCSRYTPFNILVPGSRYFCFIAVLSRWPVTGMLIEGINPFVSLVLSYGRIVILLTVTLLTARTGFGILNLFGSRSCSLYWFHKLKCQRQKFSQIEPHSFKFADTKFCAASGMCRNFFPMLIHFLRGFVACPISVPVFAQASSPNSVWSLLLCSHAMFTRDVHTRKQLKAQTNRLNSYPP